MEKSLIQGRRLHDFPASQSNLSTLWSTFSAHASEHLSNQASQIARAVDFQRPKRQYPERPRRVSTVYFIYQSEYQ